MDFTFYKYSWSKYQDGRMVNSGEFLYYISKGALYNIDDIKRDTRKILNEPDALLSIDLVTEISQEDYEAISGKPFHI